MPLWTAFLLGLVGSLHCAGMCGPLALALPVTGRTHVSFLAGRLAYNLGRIITYAALGALFGLLGHTIALAGLQRSLSIIAGAAVLLGLIASSRRVLSLAGTRAVGGLKSAFGPLLHRRTIPALFTLGLLNGLLPCGLVYVACAGAVAAGSVPTAFLSMVAFGLGTTPMMLAAGLLGAKLQPRLRFRFGWLVPASLACVGALLILRGLSLGIPYLSPDLSTGSASCCHGHPGP
jgi:uncharacterized protein